MAVTGPGARRPDGLRVLYLTASPRGDLRVDEEVRRVQKAVRAAVHRDAVHIEHQPAATLDDLLDGLTRVVPDVVAFSGHADEHSLGLDSGADTPNPGHRLPVRVFVQAMGAVDRPPSLVVLNACRSEAHLAELVRVVPLAVGMRGGIGDEAAIGFAARFYAALTDGQSVQAAYRLARLQLEGSGMPEADLPVLARGAGADPAATTLVPPHPSKPDPALA
ncbi:CHAT domain-containing protein [Actinomadura graeca]|uniref:CHAT domain-containing protein n=1 Tax=Actinomadura graeca TaxID=2750812 RepID=A0ABX8QVI3_9ACTN|nr:CHAT domain-containing protein [Actinomadura graeca]QXJ20798.1 CHAT domain-containing protein [Actinomadura graeca]